eukprot:m.187142 g.187142  ORF g.187142 m.187142 type:complete len:456 (+) comp18152_c0_seq6:146-1513(+)
MAAAAAAAASSGDGPSKTCVSFVCQYCMQPLKLDASIKAIDRQTFEALTQVHEDGGDGAVVRRGQQGPAEDMAFPKPLQHRVVKSSKNKELALDQVFASSDGGRSSLSRATRVASWLFDLMSERAEFDHPLCEECTDVLLDELDAQLHLAEDEARQCNAFLKLQSEAGAAATGGEDAPTLEEDLAALQKEERMLLAKLESLEETSTELKQELLRQEEESRVLAAQEEKYCKEYNEYQRQLEDYFEEQSSIENRFHRARERLQSLKKTNVFNDAFHIWHEGHFGTINNFRLGRLPSVPVDWSEINAAWGQTVLLLHTLAMKLGFKFQRYRLVPNGSQSYLEAEGEPGKDLPLHGSGGFKLFSDKKFDEAMVAFLDCVDQFKSHIESKEPHFKLPYRVVHGKIGDSNGELSIRIQFNQEETWTKALKFMLTNLKWCLAWVCKQMGARTAPNTTSSTA